MLDDGEVECEIDKILAHRDSKTGRRSYYVQWKGLPPEENEWLTASKPKNAADVVQDYLDDLRNKSRPAASVGRPESAVAQSIQDTANADNVVQQPEDSNAAAQPRRRQGCPKKANAVGDAAVQKHGRGRPGKQQLRSAVLQFSPGCLCVCVWPEAVHASNNRALLWNECDRYIHGGHECVMLWSSVCDEVFVVVCDWAAVLLGAGLIAMLYLL